MKQNARQLRRENARWTLLRIFEAGRPIGANEGMILRVLSDIGMRYSVAALRSELIYLQGLGLIDIDQQDGETWAAKLTANGIRVVEYSTAAPAGIARPQGD